MRNSVYALLILCFYGTQCHAQKSQMLNIKRKESYSQRILRKAADFFERNSVSDACHAFTYDPSWLKGEMFIIVLDEEGMCYTFGSEKSRIWENFAEYKDPLGESLLNRFLKSGEEAVHTIPLNNARMRLRTKKVKKDGKGFILGCGFYPDASEYVSLELVERTIQMIKEVGMPSTVRAVNNPAGAMLSGDSFLFIIRKDGRILAHGGDRAQVGKNINDQPLLPTDSPELQEEVAYRKVLIEFLQSNKPKGWLPPVKLNNTTQRIFISKYTDPRTSEVFLVGSVYFPEIDDDAIYSLVQKAITYIKAQGKQVAFTTISTPRGPLALGRGRVIVYDGNGMCLANAEDANFVGNNLIKRVDAQGHYSLRRLIEDVNKYGHAWSSEFSRNTYKLIYSEKLDLPDGALIVSAGYWPASKELTVRGMVDRAADGLVSQGKPASMYDFSGFDSDFLRGEVHITAFNTEGVVLADGPWYKHLIWSPMSMRDRYGRKVIEKILATAARGEGWVDYKQANATFRAYTRRVDLERSPKNVESVVVLSGHYVF